MTPLPATDVEVEEVFGMLRALSELEDRCLREGVGCVAPVIWCVGFGSEMSTGRREADVDVDECEALEATDADCARKAVSSRVSLLTCWIVFSNFELIGCSRIHLPPLPAPSHIPDTTPPPSAVWGVSAAPPAARCSM